MTQDPHDIETRIDRLLDKLENDNLSVAEIEKLQQKITFLKTMQE